jgi:hypothetical protein
MILELLKTDSLSEAKVVGLRALLEIVVSPSNQQIGLDVFQGNIALGTVSVLKLNYFVTTW